MSDKNILVLGVGNILFSDEGAGVAAVKALEAAYDFPPNVELMDGGTLGMRLMEMMMSHDLLVVVDIVKGGDAPGTIYRYTGDDLRKSLSFRNSMHQTDLVDSLIYCEFLGNRPETVVIGVEPFDYEELKPEVTPQMAARMPDLMAAILAELKAWGVEPTAKA